MRRFSTLLIVSICSFWGFFAPNSHAEVYGEKTTGLLELERKYPYYLFVPLEYTPQKAWPLVILLGERGDDPKKTIEPWVDWAKQKKVLVTAVPTLVPEKDIPEAADRWLIEVKREILERYHIDPANILLLGQGFGAHYAAYLAVRYPQEFAAAALTKNAWPGPFEKLIRPTSDHSRQTDFFVAVDPKQEGYDAIEKKALELERKGYQIKMETLSTQEDWLKPRDRMIQWLIETSEFRSMKSHPKTHKNLKGKWREIRKNLFQM